ncbi:MAG: hypothetical protein HUU57_09495 [Bdellovibrio sp.]|nr:hypothetical protein [Bdellovibrio sp.]
MKAYQNSTVPFGGTCVSQNRVCNNGALSGSYSYATCSAGGAASCLFNGQTIAHGQTVTAYASSSVPFGQSCTSQSRTCSNGSLSGSYAYATCSPGTAASCLFNGQTVANGQSVTAYQSSSVPYGSTCTSQTRTCSNGSLSGSYAYALCNVGSAASCNFNGQTVAHGQTVIAYANSSVPFGSTCSSQSRTCNNGSLSGSYSYSTCSVQGAANCTFNGQIVPNGSSITAYAASSVPFGQSCQSQQRTCSNGVLSGTYGASSCSTQGAASCSYPGGTLTWGPAGACSASSGPVTLAHNQSTSFTSSATMAKGNITYSCNNGNFQVASESCNPIILASGQHCDIGGPWGWKATESICPSGQKPVSADSLGGCPAGFTPYNANGVIGCYIGNSNPARPASCNGDPRDECCMWMCAANQTSVVRWQCAFQLDASGQRVYGRCTTNRRVSSRDESVITQTSCAAKYGAENCDPDTEVPYIPFEGGA